MNEEQKSAVSQVFLENLMTVISTVSESGQPQSALIGFAEDEAGNLYFQTKETSRKAANLQISNKVSFVIGWDVASLTTLQYQGSAERVTSETEISAFKQRFINKKSPAAQYLENPDVQFYKVTPTWLRYSNYKENSVWEHSF